MGREILTKSEHDQRVVIAEAIIEQVLSWLNHEAGSRILHRSFGKSVVVIQWEDGVVKNVTVENGAVLRPGDLGTLVSGPTTPVAAGKEVSKR
jgi:hypothetical protein